MSRSSAVWGGAAMLVILALNSYQLAIAGNIEIFADGFEDGASAQIAAARSTPDGPANIRVEEAIVTYAKPLIGTDAAGFFVQGSKLGPALFIAVDPATVAPQPTAGDEVSFTILQMGTASGLRQATQMQIIFPLLCLVCAEQLPGHPLTKSAA